MTIKAAVAGLGWWGRQITRSLAGSDAIRVVRAVEPAVAANAEFAREFGLAISPSLEEALADPAVEAVILCTPQNLHTDQVLAAAVAGKHVFCEKPLAMRRADAEASVAACRAAGVVLGVGHERRYEPAMRRLRGLIRDGALGTLLHGEANFSHDKLTHIKPGDWRADPRNPAAMTGMGIHLTDAFLELFGPAMEVYAAAAGIVSDRPNGDIVSVQMRFASGATAFASAILETPLFIGIRVFGSEGWAEIRNASHPDTPGPATLTVQPKGATRWSEEHAWENAVLLNLHAFAAAIRGEAPYPITDAEKIGNVAVLEAVRDSVAHGAPVRLAALARTMAD
ncbi:Gfo/Idh/MocA family oxidoreductase [Roseomonas hellenica]|uniref:Gfo/Idh/MocA family oxidoreductase n=1 Tax=Plastoroseomonas hellenica TaxID=2687306 RepID=A0ABS5F076_9PROT|nr:Gfo/Idh/MocA family oxidoreductase [Plastoroseomonas hellenica]MBR0665960.1 Gfo/Idh/MocA family oxidoreductase [Plastoroseomonas hellenica]